MENLSSCAVTGRSDLKYISNRSIRALFNLALLYNWKLLLVCKKLLVEIAAVQYQFVWAKNLSLDRMITKNVLCKQGKTSHRNHILFVTKKGRTEAYPWVSGRNCLY